MIQKPIDPVRLDRIREYVGDIARAGLKLSEEVRGASGNAELSNAAATALVSTLFTLARAVNVLRDGVEHGFSTDFLADQPGNTVSLAGMPDIDNVTTTVPNN